MTRTKSADSKWASLHHLRGENMKVHVPRKRSDSTKSEEWPFADETCGHGNDGGRAARPNCLVMVDYGFILSEALLPPLRAGTSGQMN